ncbi:hypothetical protein CHS0354_023472 [Potamilus streckersoni]|uniref:Nuclear respiratory factor 1 NLS/DNA-binding dimerisation domain-containing protein n=1 Tax=Potamilus streckersoni TaxID=2493646 RepID=A0AAE0S3W7_9BIVA|nr:hypothetical protein CHS0354_023472 [Potamilus streckersoni]
MNSLSLNSGHMSAGDMMVDDLSEPSSPESDNFDTSDLLSSSVNDDVTSQLAAAGPIGVAAAAAIVSSRKRKHPHFFETNPSRRKRQQTRLLRKLRHTIDEYTTRVGQQAVVLCCTPGKMQSMQMFKVFGSQPLENVIRSNRNVILQDLESTLADQAPPSQPDNPHLHELPPLVIDGIPTPVDKMTQAQLRNFIPEMLKYSTGRSKPGWGKPECRPPWWPSDLPWANVRSDARTEEEKKRVSWTEALRTIVKNCYKHHGREDLLHVFNEDATMNTPTRTHHTTYTGTMVQTINNPDGTVSIIQIDPGPNSVVTLPDGTQATVVHAVQDIPQQEANQAVHTLAEVASNQIDISSLGTHIVPMHTDLDGNPTTSSHHAMAALAASIGQSGGHVILTGTDSPLGSVMTMVPVTMYQTVQTLPAFSTAVTAQNVQIALATNSDSGDGILRGVPDATQAVEVIAVTPAVSS